MTPAENQMCTRRCANSDTKLTMVRTCPPREREVANQGMSMVHVTPFLKQ